MSYDVGHLLSGSSYAHWSGRLRAIDKWFSGLKCILTKRSPRGYTQVIHLFYESITLEVSWFSRTQRPMHIYPIDYFERIWPLPHVVPELR
jgi:hypothetical protein